MRFQQLVLQALGFALAACPCVHACEACDGTSNENKDIVMTRLRPRMQPGAPDAVSTPRAQLEWGQVNFLHTTDTHGWLEGHIIQQNYGADWGDYVSFMRHMKQTAINGGVDLLLVDTGDLHDGTGLADATSPDGKVSNIIFESIPYDLATIGNHELYVSAVAYETWQQFAKHYGNRYVTSNVQIYNPSTGAYEYIGSRYKYFTTPMGLRIMAFGFLFNFGGSSNASRVITTAATVNQTWFLNAVNYNKPIDLFLVLGHNPVRTTVSTSTFGTIYNVIRSMRPDVPIQFFGGHTHVRDFVVYDSLATGLESGRYCETLGWLAMTGFSHLNYSGPPGLPVATQAAIKTTASISSSSVPVTASPTLITTTTTTASTVTPTASAPANYTFKYARRYLDWNRVTFEYHANGSQVPYKNQQGGVSGDWVIGPNRKIFDTKKGLAVTSQITEDRNALNLSYYLSCAPQNWCASCTPFGSSGNIYTLLSTALAAEVVQPARSNVSRIIILNTGSVRYDLYKGPFTLDDKYIISPFDDTFQFIANVPYSYAKQILPILNTPGHGGKKRDLETRDFGFSMYGLADRDECTDPSLANINLQKRALPGSKVIRRQSSDLTPGYTTTDDFGTTGDDTIHSTIPFFTQPTYFQSNASFPTDGSTPSTVDVVFLDYFASYVVSVLQSLGDMNVTSASVQQYLPTTFTTQDYLPAYAADAPGWQVPMSQCSAV